MLYLEAPWIQNKVFNCLKHHIISTFYPFQIYFIILPNDPTMMIN